MYEPGTPRLSNYTNAEHLFWILFASLLLLWAITTSGLLDPYERPIVALTKRLLLKRSHWSITSRVKRKSIKIGINSFST